MSTRPATGSPPSPATPAALAWILVFAGSLVMAAVAAPAAFALVEAVGFATLWPFSRVFDRVAMVAALVALVVLRRSTGWGGLGALLGRGGVALRGGELAAGFAAALVAIGAGVAWAFVSRRLGPPEAPFDPWTLRTLSTVTGALAAALIEEVFFRGLLLGSLAARLRWPAAALASSLAYAGVHLLASDPKFPVAGFTPGAGFAYLGHALTRQLEPAALAPLAGLFFAGLMLALVVRRGGSLWLAIGLHAGWAASFQILRRASHVLVEIPGTSFLATHHYLVGTLWAWAAIALSGGLVLAGLALSERRRLAGFRATPA